MTIVRHTVYATTPSERIVNSQRPGIGRIVNDGGLWVVNNLGRDVTVFSFSNDSIEKHALFDETLYPDQDLESQFDLDMHALIADPFQNLWSINHFGLIRVFAGALVVSTGKESLRPHLCLSSPGDVERTFLAWPYLISSSPLGFSTDGKRRTGFLISDSVEPLIRDCMERQSKNNDGDTTSDAYSRIAGGSPPAIELGQRAFFEDWGVITAMAIRQGDEPLLAVAAGPRVGLMAINTDKGAAFVAPLLWQAMMPFETVWLEFHNGRLLCAGYDLGCGATPDEEWHLLSGGGFALVDIEKGTTIEQEMFDCQLAWGNGADTLAVIEPLNRLVAVDRFAGLHFWDLDSGRKESEWTIGESTLSKGLAHINVAGDTVLAGFNRDGYRIHVYRLGD